jgi:hypothetical protein
MTFAEAVERARDLYVKQLAAFIQAEKAKGKRGAGEVKLRLSRGPHFQHITCVDYVENDADGTVAIDMAADRILKFEPTILTHGNLVVHLEGMCWDDVIILFGGPPPDLAAWFDLWFDPEEKCWDTSAELSGRIHSLIAEDGKIFVDFGSASPEALFDLLLVLSGAGVSEVTIQTTRR